MSRGPGERRPVLMRATSTFLGAVATLTVLGAVVAMNTDPANREEGMGLRILITSLLVAALLGSLVALHAAALNWRDARRQARTGPTRGIEVEDTKDRSSWLTLARLRRWSIPLLILGAIIAFPLGTFLFGLLLLLLEAATAIYFFEIITLVIAGAVFGTILFLSRRAPDLEPVDHHPSLDEALPWAYDAISLALDDPGRVDSVPDLRRRMRRIVADGLRLSGASPDDIEAFQASLEHGDLDALHARIPDETDANTAWTWLAANAKRSGPGSTPNELARLLDKVRNAP